MSSIDKLKLLAGLPIPMSDLTFSVYPATLMEIAVLGVEEYFRYVNILTLNKKEIEAMSKDPEMEIFDFILINCIHSQEFKNTFLEALKFFTREEVLFVKDMYCFIIGNFENQSFLSSENYEEFQTIIREQNVISEKEKAKGENLMAKRIREKLAKSRKIIDRVKQSKSEISLVDLIGSLSINTSLSIDRIWNISYYTFNDQFKRMRMVEQYETGLQSILAGADPKKVKLEDWIKNIQ